MDQQYDPGNVFAAMHHRVTGELLRLMDGLYSNIEDGYTGTNNISADPQFVNPASDFHVAAHAPGEDAGNNGAQGVGSTDLDGGTRILGGTVDMGAYEKQ